MSLKWDGWMLAVHLPVAQFLAQGFFAVIPVKGAEEMVKLGKIKSIAPGTAQHRILLLIAK
ncbi:hypothetical protein CSZ94_04325 [Janthinobacterium sp. ROICE36]|nr:hypothetical protein CSZ94_04325 [Janthinobacterium sp. ROICE36]